jgi:serine/threonine-protein kinase
VLAPGTTLNRYVVETPIGSGGMGAVYRARDTHLDRAVALKVLSDGIGGIPDKEARERLVREARAAAALSHPNAVSIYDAGDSEHGPFIVMELVEGETLRGAMARGVTPAQVVSWMKMAALALGEAHERGIVHRDIKPENLMLRPDGIAKVLDFGIARQASKAQDPSEPTHAALPTLTGTGVQIGTPQYMAPEQIKGKKLDGRTDQFSWAVTAYEALSGRLPWHADNGALGVVACILEEVPPDVSTLVPGVPPHVGAVIAKAMQKRPEDRFASMRELVRALDGLGPSEARAPEPEKVSVPPPASRPVASLGPETRFGEGTVKAVIGKALSLENQGGYSKSELKDAALELGISEAALEEAASVIRAEKARALGEKADAKLVERILVRRRRGFIHHFIAYLGINAIIAMPGLMHASAGKLWPFFIPAIAWGIGLAIHALRALSSYVDPREIREEIRREEREIAKDAARRAALAERLERRARHDKMKRDASEIGAAVEEGVASLLGVAAQKIRDNSERAGGPRVRVAQPTDADRQRADADAERAAARMDVDRARIEAEHDRIEAEIEADLRERARGRRWR